MSWTQQCVGFVSVYEISPLGIFTEHNHIVEDADNVQSILHMRVIKRHGSTLDYKSHVCRGPAHPIPSHPVRPIYKSRRHSSYDYVPANAALPPHAAIREFRERILEASPALFRLGFVGFCCRKMVVLVTTADVEAGSRRLGIDPSFCRLMWFLSRN